MTNQINLRQLDARGRVKPIQIGNSRYLFYAESSTLEVVPSFPPEVTAPPAVAPLPPAKTLILHVTYKCGLSCRHCYLNAGAPAADELSADTLVRIVKGFGEMGGLCIDISGGEPLLKPGIDSVVQEARKQRLRTVLLTNGTTLTSSRLRRLKEYLDGIAVGLDGLREANDAIRGQGSFRRIVRGLGVVSSQDIPLSVTTLITADSVPQLIEMVGFLAQFRVESWSLVLPRPSGRFAQNQADSDAAMDAWRAAVDAGLLPELHLRASGSGIDVIVDHVLVTKAKAGLDAKSNDLVYCLYNKGRACWENTITVMPNGDVRCCLFFDGHVYGNLAYLSLSELYRSRRREIAIDTFRKFPVEVCPLLTDGNRDLLRSRLS